MNLQDYLKVIEKFVSDYLKNTGMSKYMLGLSGGVDSSLVALLTQKAVGNDKLLVVMIPIESNPDDLNDAKRIVKQFKLNSLTIDGTSIYKSALESLQKENVLLNVATKSNLKVRIRMIILYAIAQMNNALVIGTDNADERYTGYFTKYGDGGVDLLPIVHLLKREVVEASKLYGLPDDLAERVPSAGLFSGQTDESEMGISYRDLDNFLMGQTISDETKEKIERLHRISEHKRSPIPSPVPFRRDS
ncbi:MAG: NAD(+) synthase [Bacilli bacterium]|nr:NAD(+) synthase [Bacilli bacterium]